MKRIFFILCLPVIFLSCNKENPTSSDLLCFGSSYGMCINNCATFYLLNSHQLFPDNMQTYSEPFVFSSSPLSNEKYLIGKQVIDNFPAYLNNNPDTSFGCADCTDQGAVHIERVQGGVRKLWHFDTDTSKLPIELRIYIQQVKDIIVQL